MNEPSRAAIFDDMSQLGREALITLAGLLASVAVVVINYAIETATSFDVLSISFWFVIPAGAFCGGMGAAGGYFGAARLTHTMPSRTMLLNMVAVGLSTWLLYRWIGYVTLTFDDGRRVADLVPFWEYYKISTEAMQLSIGTRGNFDAGTTGELGRLGYAREALQVVGFMAGGFVSYQSLSEVDACASCRRYAKESRLLENVSSEVYDGVLATSAVTLPGLVEQLEAAVTRRGFVGLGLNEYTCTKCGAHWLRPTVIVGTASSSETVKLGRYNATEDLLSRVRDASQAAKATQKATK